MCEREVRGQRKVSSERWQQIQRKRDKGAEFRKAGKRVERERETGDKGRKKGKSAGDKAQQRGS